ncbi:MAG: hypothetical protein ACYDB7_12795 [Mycobacteriales bacterium]
MDIDTIDQRYQQLQTEAAQVVTTLQGLAQKMQAAAQTGDQNAREWLLDLKEVALDIKDEQTQASALLQAMHDFVVNTLQPAPAQQAAAPVAPVQYAQPGYGGGYAQGGGLLQRFMGGGFGRAIAMGAGFGIGDDIINSIF